ncbi:MAG: hypothetical protein H6Q17_441 [Bacteroidetes bacterium]|nr:hypothetical protein [Bacteroidota bacterium]
MQIVLSPSKTIDFHTPAPSFETTQPLFASTANRLMAELRHFTAEEIALREEVSLKIAFASQEYAHSFSTMPGCGKPALFAYTGNVYDKLHPATFGENEVKYAQEHLRIFSALYGLLRPLDLIQAYRLDMNSQLIEGLYDVWRKPVTEAAIKAVQADDNVLVNLASAEYFKLLDVKKLPAGCRIITPVFKQEHHGKYSVKSLYAKQARGWMAHFIIENRITDPEYLQGFSEEGYYFCPEMSKKNEWVFIR